jgi:hypothetical protein
MFSPRLFPDGDRGGNSVKARQAGNLHSLWDGFPGRDDSYRGARNKAIALIEDAQYQTAGKTAGATLDEIAWRDESYTLATSTVYDEEVVPDNDSQAVGRVERVFGQRLVHGLGEAEVDDFGDRLAVVEADEDV